LIMDDWPLVAGQLVNVETNVAKLVLTDC
jgi:hypothetical protein